MPTDFPPNVGVNCIAAYFKIVQGGELVCMVAIKMSGNDDVSLNITPEGIAAFVEEGRKQAQSFADSCGEEPLIVNDDGTPGPSGKPTVEPATCQEHAEWTVKQKEADEELREKHEQAREDYFDKHGCYPEDDPNHPFFRDDEDLG